MPWYNDRVSFNKAGLTFPYRPGNSRSSYTAPIQRETEDREEFNKPPAVKSYRPGSPEHLATLGYRPGSNPRDLIFDNTNTTCVADANCATGFTCIGGRCQEDQGEKKAGTGSGDDCNDPDPERQDCPCDKQTCGPRKCCYGPIYTRLVPRPGGGLIYEERCEPFEDRNCSSRCTSHYRMFGTLASGCTMENTCYDGRCVNGECEKDNSKCNTGRGCGDCEQCNDNGSCVFSCDGCMMQCSSSNVRCECGNVYVSGTASIPYCKGGNAFACQQKIREAVKAKCDIVAPCDGDKGKSCDSHQYRGKTLKCECKSVQTTCPESGQHGGGYCEGFAEAGKICFDRGKIFVPDPDAKNNCLPGTKVTKFGKICELDDDDGCNGPLGCPAGQRCNQQTGFCEDDDSKPECDSGNVCNGSCCETGTECVPYRRFRVADNCHNRGDSFFAPAGGPTLNVLEAISEEASVCGRPHTHCAVVVNCYTVAMHLECGNGLVDLGPAGFSGCPAVPISYCDD